MNNLKFFYLYYNIMDIDNIIHNYFRYINRSNKFLNYIENNLKCTICYDKYINRKYECSHTVCSRCFRNTDKCPYCRKPKNKLDYWLFDRNKKWYQITDDVFKYGLDDDFNYTNYLDKLSNIIEELLLISNNYLLDKNHLYTIVYLINKISNFPIFYYDEKNIIFKNFIMIKKTICKKLNISENNLQIKMIHKNIKKLAKKITV